MPSDPPASTSPSSFPGGISRRSFLKGVGAAGSLGLVTGLKGFAAGPESAPGLVRHPADGARVTFSLNGRSATFEVLPSETLLDVLREKAGLTGAKRICDRGACGGCTVMVDGRAVNSCMMLALDAEGREVRTVEALARGDRLDPIQEAFRRHDACQCGYCTPGFVVSARALFDRNPAPSSMEIRRGLAGNICRCGTQPKIFQALEELAQTAGTAAGLPTGAGT